MLVFPNWMDVYLYVQMCGDVSLYVHLCGKGTALVSVRGSEFWEASGAIRSSSVPLMLSGVKGDCKSPVADSCQIRKNKIIGFRSSCVSTCAHLMICREWWDWVAEKWILSTRSDSPAVFSCRNRRAKCMRSNEGCLWKALVVIGSQAPSQNWDERGFVALAC